MNTKMDLSNKTPQELRQMLDSINFTFQNAPMLSDEQRQGLREAVQEISEALKGVK